MRVIVVRRQRGDQREDVTSSSLCWLAIFLKPVSEGGVWGCGGGVFSRAERCGLWKQKKKKTRRSRELEGDIVEDCIAQRDAWCQRGVCRRGVSTRERELGTKIGLNGL